MRYHANDNTTIRWVVHDSVIFHKLKDLGWDVIYILPSPIYRTVFWCQMRKP